MNSWDIITHVNTWIAFCSPLVLLMAFSGVHAFDAMRFPDKKFKVPNYLTSKYFWFCLFCASAISSGLTIALLKVNLVFPPTLTWTISMGSCFLIVKGIPLKKNKKEND